MLSIVARLLATSTASIPLSAGKGGRRMGFRPKASRVNWILFVMYGRSRTSSLGLTMKLLMYQPKRDTITYATAAGTIAAASQRNFGAETAFTKAMSA